jgi:hypothetical protein
MQTPVTMLTNRVNPNKSLAKAERIILCPVRRIPLRVKRLMADIMLTKTVKVANLNVERVLLKM